MSANGKYPHRPVFCFVTALLLLAAIDFAFVPICSNAQTGEKVRSLPGQFFQEENCPVLVTQTRTELDIDPFNLPVDARVYVTYTNLSPNPITAVSFRVRLCDPDGKNLGTFRGSDSALVNAQESRSQQFKHEGIDPHVAAMQIRVLQVRYADGTTWESAKMRELNPSGEPETGVAPSAVPGP